MFCIYSVQRFKEIAQLKKHPCTLSGSTYLSWTFQVVIPDKRQGSTGKMQAFLYFPLGFFHLYTVHFRSKWNLYCRLHGHICLLPRQVVMYSGICRSVSFRPLRVLLGVCSQVLSSSIRRSSVGDVMKNLSFMYGFR